MRLYLVECSLWRACCFVVRLRLGLGLGLDLVSGWLTVMDTCLYKHVCITVNQHDTKSNPNPNPDPNRKLSVFKSGLKTFLFRKSYN